MSPKSTTQLILASVSPRREHLLRTMGLDFTVVPPPATEELLEGGPPETLAITNARNKAASVAGRYRDALVIGADTMVVLAGKIFGKPSDLAEAKSMLQQLVGREHEVLTAVCLIRRAANVERSFCASTRVWMRALTPDKIDAYLRKIDPLDKAGAYAVQEHGDLIMERIDGSFHNVMGLPTEQLRAELERLGVSVATG